MQDIYTRLSQMRRPRLLVSAARHGIADYDRQRVLAKLLGSERLPGPVEALIRLMEIEAGHNETRKEMPATYQAARHVDVLIALMSEARALEDARTLRPV